MESAEGTSNYKAQVLGNYCDLGFDLTTPDDHALFLLHEGERIAVFSQSGATLECIRSRCSSHLLVNHGAPVYESAPAM